MMRMLLAKLLTYRSFLKFYALHMLGIVGVAFTASHLATVSFQNLSLPLGDLFGRPGAWQTVCSLTHWLFYIPSFFVVQLVCAELELKLVRAQVIAGLERRDVIKGWLGLNLGIVLSAVLATMLSVLLFSHASDAPGDIGLVLRSEWGYCLYGIGLLNWSLFSAVLLRRPVPALALLTVWPLIIEPAIGFTMERQGLGDLARYLPWSTLGGLVPLPMFGAAFAPLAPTTFACIGYAVLAVLVAWGRLQRLDL